MSKPFSRISGDMQALAKKLEARMNSVVVDAAATAGGQIALDNPIDTGLSSGNWQGSIGRDISRQALEFLGPNASVVRMRLLRTQKKQTGEPVTIFNAVDYVPKIIYEGTKTSVPMWAPRAAERGMKLSLKSAKLKGG